MKAKQPDVEFVTEQAPPLGKVDAGAVAQAIDDAKPDAIFNVLFGGTSTKFVREGNTRGTFKDRFVGSLLARRARISRSAQGRGTGRLDRHRLSLVRDRHAGEQGLPRRLSEEAINDYPRLGSVVGYVTVKSMAAGIAKAGSTDTEKVVDAFSGLEGG